MDTKQLDEQVEKILTTTTVSRAQEIMSSRSGLWLIGFISFLESASPLPVVTDPFMIAAIMLNRTKYIRIVLITTFTSVLGGVAAYYAALFFFDIALDWFSPETTQVLAAMTTSQEKGTFLLTLIGAFTPVPYTLTAWAVGFMKGGVVPFIIASIIGRGARYAIVGWLTYRFGPLALQYAKRSIGIASLVMVILIGLYLWHKM